jgi:hypothetical protein
VEARRKDGSRESRPRDHRKRWQVSVGALISLVALLLPGPGGQFVVAQETEQALVRFVHVSPDAPPLDVYVDGQVVVKGVEFPTATDFLPFPEGEHHIQITPAESTVDGALVDIDQTLDRDTSYEIVAIGLLNDVEGEVFEVDTSLMQGANLARVRLIHAAPNLGPVDVSIEGGDTLFADIDFPDDSGYRDVTADILNLTLSNSDNSLTLARLDELAAEPGWVYDIFIVGQQQNDTLQFLALKAPAALACASILGVGTLEDGCVRFVHASPDAPPLAIYLDDNNEPYQTGLAFGDTTNFLALPEGEHRIRVVLEGAALEDAVIDTTIGLDARMAIEVTVSNVLESLEINTYPLNLGPLPAGQARVRVVHLVAGADPIDVLMPDGTLLVEAVGFGEDSESAALPSGPVAVEVIVSGEEEVLVPATRLTFQAGKVYDVVVTGLTDGEAPDVFVLTAPSISAWEREGIEPAGGDGAPAVASPEIVPTVTPTPQPS